MRELHCQDRKHDDGCHLPVSRFVLIVGHLNNQQVMEAKMEIIENCKRAINTCLRNTTVSTEVWTMLNGETADMSTLEKVPSCQGRE